MLGYKFTPEVKNTTTNSQKTRFLEIYDFKSAGDQMVSMVSTPIQLEHEICILVTPQNMLSSF